MMPRIYIRDQNDEVLDTLDEGQYFDDNMQRFLKGKATVLSFTIVKDEASYALMSAGRNLSFRYDEEDFWLSCVIVEQDETYLTVTAWSLGLELNNETHGPYKAPKAMTFAEYLAVIDIERILTLGLNEVSDKKISHEWEGTESKLARLYSLATIFSAELAFDTELNEDGSLKQISLNVYREHSDADQGLGQDRRNETFYFGEDIKTIRKTEDTSDLYTAIFATGKDGLTIAGIEKEVFDEDGNLLFATYKTQKPGFGDPRKLYAPQARDQFPSNTTGGDRWTLNTAGEFEYESAEALLGYMMSELKKNCQPATTWAIEGYIKAKIGDTVRIADEGYKPTLYLEARVIEQEISFSDKTKNKSTFSNVVELESDIDPVLLNQVQKLIEANKTYQYSISTDNGVVFKNNTGTTTLTATVRDGVADVTANFDITWFKDGVSVGTGVSLTVRATDVAEKAVYRFEASKVDGTVAGGYEVTVSDVTDGEEGFSPIVTPNDNGTITIVDKEGEKITPDLTGPQGPPGEVDQELIDEITNTAEDAKKAGEAAQEAAEQAEADSALAVKNANSAVDKANEASAKADQSQQTAEQAKSDAANAAGKAQSALDSAGQAVSSATDALNQANLAKSQAEEAINKYLGMGMVPAWSWSPDGTDRFTNVYPGENLFNNEAPFFDPAQWIVEEPGVYLRTGTNPACSTFDIPNILEKAYPGRDFTCENMAISFEIEPLVEGVQFTATDMYINNQLSVPYNRPTLTVGKKSKVYASFVYKKGTAGTAFMHIYFNTLPTKAIRLSKFKLEINDSATIYTPAPSEDYTNAVPSYIGFAIEPSDNPADYTWIRNPDKVEGEVKVELTDINGELSRKVSQETFDQLNGTVINHSTLISQNQNEIKQKASQESVNTLTGRVTTAEGSISTIAGQVALKANQTDVDTIAGRVTSAESQLTVQAGKITGLTSVTDGHTSKIGALELQAGQFSLSLSSVQNDLNSLEIGGRNYWRLSNPQINLSSWTWDKTENTFIYNSTNTSVGSFYISNIMNYSFPDDSGVGKTMTVSLDVISNKDGLQFSNANLYINNNLLVQHNRPILVVGERVRIRATFVYVKPTSGTQLMHFYVTVPGGLSAGDITICNLKLEVGNKATDWSPAPEDMATVTSLTEVKATVDSLTMTVADKADKTTVTQLANQWQQTTSLVNGHTSQISSLGDAINLRVEKDDIINQINISPESILIAGQKVHITGQTTIDSAVIKTAHIADAAITNAKIGSLSADKVTVGTLNGANVNIINLDAKNILADTFTGLTFRGVEFIGSQFINDYTSTDPVTGVSTTGQLDISGGGYLNQYTNDDGTGGMFYIDQFGRLFNSRNTYGVQEDFELNPGGLALHFGDYFGTLTAQMLSYTTWIEIPLKSGFQTAENNPPSYRVQYNVDGTRTVKFRGQVTTTNAALPNAYFTKNIDYYWGQMPADLLPEKNSFFWGCTGATNLFGGRLVLSLAHEGQLIFNSPHANVNYVSLDGWEYTLEN